jgi:hypothetical protein
VFAKYARFAETVNTRIAFSTLADTFGPRQ